MSHEVMTVKINGEAMDVNVDITLAALLSEKALDKGRFVAVINDEIIPRSDYATTIIKTADSIDIMTPITGG